jgi:NitT/TauT family transport system substrate-binding protein
MNIGRVTAGMAAVFAMTAGSAAMAQAEPFRISYFVWPGNGPFFVAKEKGLFAKESVEVELVNIEDHAAIFAALDADQVQAVQGAFSDAPVFSEPNEEPWACVLALDDSRGADGVLATADIRTIAELKGKTVAAHRDGLPGLYLNLLLREAGLDGDDVELVDLGAEDAAQAFLLREVDAAVTYDPFLREAMQAGHGHLLTDSSEQPGLMFDCLMTKRSVLEARKDEFKGVARAWDAAVRYVEAHPDEANEIMARHVGGGLDDPAAFAETLKGVSLYDAEANRAFFGTPEQPGPIYETMQLAIHVLSDAGQLKTELTPADVIAHGILNE